MKTIKIKLHRNGDLTISGSKFAPKQLIDILVETLAYQICRLKKPDVDIDDLYISACNSIGNALDKHHAELYPFPNSFEWEVV